MGTAVAGCRRRGICTVPRAPELKSLRAWGPGVVCEHGGSQAFLPTSRGCRGPVISPGEKELRR